MQELKQKLLNDLKTIGIDVEFKLVLRPYSKTLFGRYNPKTREVVVYVYKYPDRSEMHSYEELLLTTIHEAVHCIQWSSKDFVRVKGIMHNPEFHRLYAFYKEEALELLSKRRGSQGVLASNF